MRIFFIHFFSTEGNSQQRSAGAQRASIQHDERRAPGRSTSSATAPAAALQQIQPHAHGHLPWAIWPSCIPGQPVFLSSTALLCRIGCLHGYCCIPHRLRKGFSCCWLIVRRRACAGLRGVEGARVMGDDAAAGVWAGHQGALRDGVKDQRGAGDACGGQGVPPAEGRVCRLGEEGYMVWGCWKVAALKSQPAPGMEMQTACRAVLHTTVVYLQARLLCCIAISARHMPSAGAGSGRAGAAATHPRPPAGAAGPGRRAGAAVHAGAGAAVRNSRGGAGRVAHPPHQPHKHRWPSGLAAGASRACS